MPSRQSGYRIRFAMMAVINTLLLNPSVQATENPAWQSWGGIKASEFGKGFYRDRGFSFGEEAYIQPTKTPDKYGLAVNPEQKRYSWSFSHRGFSVQKRF